MREFEVEAGAVEGPDAMLLEACEEQVVLAVGEPVNRFTLGPVVRLPLGQADPTAREEDADGILTRPSMDESGIIDPAAEERVGDAGELDPPGEELIERLLPRVGVD